MMNRFIVFNAFVLIIIDRVHEYGGGAFCVYNEVIYFTNFNDQRFYAQTSASPSVEALTADETHCRYADGEFQSQVRKLIFLISI